MNAILDLFLDVRVFQNKYYYLLMYDLSRERLK